MPLEAEMIELMQDEVTIEPYLDVNKYNDIMLGPPVAVKCWITRMNVRTLDRSGRETTSTVQVILSKPELNVSVDDRLTLPDGTRPAIIEILAANDDVGPYLLEIRA